MTIVYTYGAWTIELVCAEISLYRITNCDDTYYIETDFPIDDSNIIYDTKLSHHLILHEDGTKSIGRFDSSVYDPNDNAYYDEKNCIFHVNAGYSNLDYRIISLYTIDGVQLDSYPS